MVIVTFPYEKRIRIDENKIPFRIPIFLSKLWLNAIRIEYQANNKIFSLKRKFSRSTKSVWFTTREKPLFLNGIFSKVWNWNWYRISKARITKSKHFDRIWIDSWISGWIERNPLNRRKSAAGAWMNELKKNTRQRQKVPYEWAKQSETENEMMRLRKYTEKKLSFAYAVHTVGYPLSQNDAVIHFWRNVSRWWFKQLIASLAESMSLWFCVCVHLHLNRTTLHSTTKCVSVVVFFCSFSSLGQLFSISIRYWKKIKSQITESRSVFHVVLLVHDSPAYQYLSIYVVFLADKRHTTFRRHSITNNIKIGYWNIFGWKILMSLHFFLFRDGIFLFFALAFFYFQISNKTKKTSIKLKTNKLTSVY